MNILIRKAKVSDAQQISELFLDSMGFYNHVCDHGHNERDVREERR